jgi:hypothetical protein
MKKVNLLLFAAIWIAACSGNAEKRLFTPDNPNIAYIGRFDFSDRKQPVFMYSGCEIRTVFKGTSVELIMADDSLRNWFNVFIDDSSFVIVADRKDSTYLLASDLQKKKHTLSIIRRTEWHGGNTTLIGLRIDKRGKLYKPEVKERRIEFIGDSYTCGYGIEGKSHDEHFTYSTENNYLTFGAVTARSLSAEYLTICRSGIGIVQGYGGGRDFTMPRFYDEITNDSTKVWDYKLYQPQLVVIDLAGNDLSAPLDSTEFVNASVKFLKRIRTNYASSKIVCVAGPSSPDEGWLKWQNLIHGAVNEFGRTDKDAYYFAFTSFEPSGSDWHPNVEEHKKMSEELIPFLKDLMHW